MPFLTPSSPLTPECINQELSKAFVQVTARSCRKHYKNLVRKNPGSLEAPMVDSMIEALEGLGNLWAGRPDYNNPSLPIFYASWYHLAHVRMCFNILEDTTIPWDPKNRNIIFDVGCGTFAMLWAVIYQLAYWQALEKRPIPRFHIRLFDGSEPLLEMGERMYKELRAHVRKHVLVERIRTLLFFRVKYRHDVMKALKKAIQAIDVEVCRRDDFPAFARPAKEMEGKKLISGIHVIYSDDAEFHENIIRTMRQSDYGILTYSRQVTGRREEITQGFLERVSRQFHRITIPLDDQKRDGDWFDAAPLRELRSEIRDAHEQLAQRCGKLLPGSIPQVAKAYAYDCWNNATHP